MATEPLLPQINSVMPEMTQAERDTVIPETDPWSDDRAAAIAIGDFRKAETYRNQSHDWRFTRADQLYLGWQTRKSWEGTKIPRSSVAVYIVLENLEALLPSLVGSLFPDENELPFEVDPDPVSSIQQATAVRDLLNSQIKNLGYREFISLREIIRRMLKSELLYGNGIAEFGWLKKTETREVWQRGMMNTRIPVPHYQTGEPILIPGPQVPYVHHQMTQYPVSKPCVWNHDIRDFYWDPNCSSSNIQDGSYCLHRTFMTINDLMGFQNQEGFQIPDKQTLLSISKNKSMTQGDNSKTQLEAFRGSSWQPYIDQSIDPNLARVELIRYWQKNRHVWIIRNFNKPLYNQPNQYGVLPFLTTAYIDVPSRWAGMSLPDLCESDQSLAETIINARIDELALMIHRPLVKKRGMALPLSQQKMRPGVIWEADDPQNDYKWLEPSNVTAQAFVEVDALERRVQKKTGITDLAVLGTPSAGGNSANRTATGIQSQGAASGKRIQYQVENFEDQLLVPLLNVMHSMNQKFLSPEEIIQIIGPEGQLLQIDPVDILNASVKFTITASGRMRQRAALQGGGSQLLFESIMNPALAQSLGQQGIKVNMQTVGDMLTDALNAPRKSIFIPMSPQEQQAFQKQQQMQEMIRMQMQQDRLQAQGDNQDKKDDTELMKSLIAKLLTPQAAHLVLNQLAGSQLDTSTGKEPQAGDGE